MREYVHLHRKIVASWVFEDPRRLQLFIYLLAKADERGVVRLSVNECAKKLDINRNSLRTIIRQMEDEGVVHQQPTNKNTIVTLCKYAYYNTPTTNNPPTTHQQTTNKPTSEEEKEGERERKVPPHPFIKKEKEKEREELSATVLRRESEEEGQGFLFQELKEENDCAAVNTEDSTPKAPSTEDPEAPTFEQFWEAYAYKRDRRSAERAWKRLSAADRRAACEGIAAYRADCEACERQMMYAQGYLNRRRWEDDFTTPSRPRGTQHHTFQQPQSPSQYELHSHQATDPGRYSREEQRTAERNNRAREAAELIARLAAKNRPVG